MAAPRPSIVAIYPGSFDPITNGHLDVIARGSKLAERLIVAVLRNAGKQPMFSVPERMEMLREATSRASDFEKPMMPALAAARFSAPGCLIALLIHFCAMAHPFFFACFPLNLPPALSAAA